MADWKMELIRNVTDPSLTLDDLQHYTLEQLTQPLELGDSRSIFGDCDYGPLPGVHPSLQGRASGHTILHYATGTIDINQSIVGQRELYEVEYKKNILTNSKLILERLRELGGEIRHIQKVMKPNNRGVTPLHYAALNKNPECLLEFVNTLGDIAPPYCLYHAMGGGWTPLHLALKNQREDSRGILAMLDVLAPNDVLIEKYCDNFQHGVVTYFRPGDTSVNAYSVLHLAAKYQIDAQVVLKIIKILKKSNMDVEELSKSFPVTIADYNQEHYGYPLYRNGTPLHYALSNKETQPVVIEKMLGALGKKRAAKLIFQYDCTGNTALHYAAKYQHDPAIFKLLLSYVGGDQVKHINKYTKKPDYPTSMDDKKYYTTLHFLAKNQSNPLVFFYFFEAVKDNLSSYLEQTELTDSENNSDCSTVLECAYNRDDDNIRERLRLYIDLYMSLLINNASEVLDKFETIINYINTIEDGEDIYKDTFFLLLMCGDSRTIDRVLTSGNKFRLNSVLNCSTYQIDNEQKIKNFIALLKHMKNPIERLVLSNCGLSDKMIIFFAKSLVSNSDILSGLTHLDISDNQMTYHGACFLAKYIKFLPNINHLDMSANLIQIEDDLFEDLSDRFNRNIKNEPVILDISRNYLKSSCDQMFASNQYGFFRTQACYARSMIRPDQHLKPEKWLIALTCKKGTEHAMIYIEGMRSNGQCFFKRFHITAEGIIGKAQARIEHIDLKHFDSDKYNFQVFTEIENTSCEVLINLIKSEMGENIPFSKFYPSSRRGKVNCLLWAIKKLSEIDIEVDGTFFGLPSNAARGRNCAMM